MKFLLGLGLILLVAGCGEREVLYQQLEGEPIRFSDLEEKVVFINYWADWCKPCREEIPVLNHVQRQYSDRVVVLGVNFDGVIGKELEKQVRDLNIEFGILLDDPRGQFGKPPSGILPETLVIDSQGDLLRVLVGAQTEESLENLLSGLLSLQELPDGGNK